VWTFYGQGESIFRDFVKTVFWTAPYVLSVKPITIHTIDYNGFSSLAFLALI